MSRLASVGGMSFGAKEKRRYLAYSEAFCFPQVIEKEDARWLPFRSHLSRACSERDGGDRTTCGLGRIGEHPSVDLRLRSPDIRSTTNGSRSVGASRDAADLPI